MDVFSIPPYVINQRVEKATFLAALKFIRSMNLVRNCFFEPIESTKDSSILMYRVTHITPPLLVPFIKRRETFQTEIINFKNDSEIIITSTPLNPNEIPFMKTITVFSFSDVMTVRCHITAKLFKNKKIPPLVRGIFTDFAKKKATVLRDTEKKTYNQLNAVSF